MRGGNDGALCPPRIHRHTLVAADQMQPRLHEILAREEPCKSLLHNLYFWEPHIGGWIAHMQETTDSSHRRER